MSILVWVAIAYSAVGFVGASRRVFREWAEDFSPLSGGDLAFGLFIGVFFGAIAVFYPPFVGLCWVTRGADFDEIARVIGGEDPEKKRMRRLKKQAERKREIERLERELEIS